MYPGWLPEGALPVLGMRGRLGSEHGPTGGGCCERVDTDCDGRVGCGVTADGWEGRGGMIEGDEARAARGKVSGVGLIDGGSGSRLPDITGIGGWDSQKRSRREFSFVSACFSSSVFVMTRMSCNDLAT